MAPAEQDPNAKYEVRHQIGRGSFGSAFLVTNKQDKADYVLKRVRLAKQTKWQRNSTLQERDLATSLRHPFIVPCVESWVVQNHTVNMIYAFCQNGDLSGYLSKIRKQEGQVEEGVMQKWLCQLLLALDYLQTQGVLHRDIKTSNLMLTCDNDVQLGDFGLATLMEEDGDEHKPQDTNLVGTPHYMSPELLSCKAYGFKTDVWSLGCVFYELTAQRPTFNAFNIHGLVSKIKKNKLAPLPSSYSTDWKDAIELMLCKNPDKRPSVQQLMALPVLRLAMLEARARAQELMPSVPLPPLLDPTPLTPQPLLGQYRLSGAQDVADESEGSAGGASDQQGGPSCGGGSDAGSSRMSSRADRRSAAGLTAAQAVQASELSDLWKANFGTLQQQEQLDTECAEQQSAADAQAAGLRQQCKGPCGAQDSLAGLRSAGGGSDAGSRKAGSAGGCSPAGSSSSAITPGQAAADGKGLGVGYSPRNGLCVIDGYKRILTPPRQAHVNQPGIKRTPSERVAAAIAAAGGSPAQAAAAAATAAGCAATGRVTPDLCPRPTAPSGPSLARTSRSSSSSKRATSGTLTPEQQPGWADGSPPAQVSPAGSSVTPRLPSSSSSSTKQRPSTSLTPRQDSACKHRASDCTHVHSSGASTVRPRTGQQADKLFSPADGGAAPTAAAGTPTRPLSAPRSSSVRRMSDRGPQGPSSGGGSKQQRPAWGAGGRSCLTPGRQRPEQSPIQKAAKASTAAAVAAGLAAAVLPAGAGILAAAAAAAAGKKQRRSHGQLSPSEKLSARGAGSPATAIECVAERGTPDAQEQEQERPPRRSNSSGSAGKEAAQAGAAEQPAHGLSRSSSNGSAAAKQQQPPQQQQTASEASPQGASAPLQHRRSSPGGAALPPLPLNNVQRSSGGGRDDMQSPALSPIPLASPVHGQDMPGPVSTGAALRSTSKQQQPSASGSPFSKVSAAAQSARASDSAGQQTDAQRATAARAQHSGRSASALSGRERSEGCTETSVDLKQKAHAALAAVTGAAQTSAPGSTSSSRRVSGASSTSRQSSGGGQGLVSPGNLSSRCSSLQVAEQQHLPEALRIPATGSSPIVSRHNSGSATPKREQQQHQQQQEAQQQQSTVQQSQQPDQQVLQRLELLESAMMVIGGLVERKRWTELSSLMRSDGLLPTGVMSQHAAAAGSHEQQQQAASHVLKLGDIVVLGRSRSIRGKIRYIGPVAWDPSAADWVGTELDRPCGVDATQRGLTYFDCQPLCASFHKASDLTTLGG